MPIDMTEVKKLFFEESLESLDIMEATLLDVQVGEIDKEQINSIFRCVHSIKGGAGIFQYEQVINFAHVAETLLDEMRNGEHLVTQHIVDLLLRSVDILRMLLSGIQDNTPVNDNEVEICQQALEAMIKANNTNITENQLVTDNVEEVKTEEKEDEPQVWRINFQPYEDMLLTGNDPINLLRELRDLGQLKIKAKYDNLPDFNTLNPRNCYLAWELELITNKPYAEIYEVFEWVEGDCHLEIDCLSAECPPERTVVTEYYPNEYAQPEQDQTPEPEETPKLEETPEEKEEKPEPKERSTKSNGSDTGSIRVAIDKIDALINIVGELVITQSMLDQIGENFNTGKIDSMRSGLAQLERNTRELQESVMRIRMLPINFSFSRFPRLVHDLSTQLGKKVQLELSGEQTELDKTVLEKMSDPLVHLVRNALDHGIEMPPERLAKGKPETGILRLHAFHQSSSIIIQVSDDGAGFDAQKIRHKAIEKQLINPDDNLSEEQLYDLIFLPGFSTATNVSDLSGRGVGMDVVRRNIRSLGGSIEVRSAPDKGTKFTIRLPLTLAILDGQLVRVGEQIYILPLLSIVESLRIKKKYVNGLAGKVEVYKLRDEFIPILRLYDLFDINASLTNLEHGLLVVVEGEGQKLGLFVDELLSQQQIVIKSLETNYKQVEGISGATILGNGEVALILDTSGLLHLFHKYCGDYKNSIQIFSGEQTRGHDAKNRTTTNCE
jgi:two-component system, chemotaxis family, sensor kinase CheA